MFFIELGKIIHKLRKKKGISQTVLGQFSELAQMTVTRLERGDGEGLRLGSLKKIAEVLEISLADLFFELEKGKERSTETKSHWHGLISKLNSLTPSKKQWMLELIEKVLHQPV